MAADASRPVRASSAAACEMDDAFEVVWLWYEVIAAISSGGPTAQPRRQPVIAKVLDAAPVITIRS